MAGQTALLDEALEHVTQGANPEWMAEAREALIVLWRRGLPFTTDELHELMTLVHVETRDTRALGAVIRRAVKAGALKRIGFKASTRPECNKRPVSIWQPVKGVR